MEALINIEKWWNRVGTGEGGEAIKQNDILIQIYPSLSPSTTILNKIKSLTLEFTRIYLNNK